MRLGRYGDALTFVTEALSLARTTASRSLEVNTLYVLGDIRAALGDLDDALGCYEQAAPIAMESGRSDIIGATYRKVGRIHALMGEYRAAISFALKALERTGPGLQDETALPIHTDLAAAYEAVGDFENALKHYKRRSEIRERRLVEEKEEAMAVMRTRFDLEHLEQENRIQQLRMEQLQQEVDHRNGELARQALKLVQKNEILAGLEARIKASNGWDDRTCRTVLAHLRSAAESEGEWEAIFISDIASLLLWESRRRSREMVRSATSAGAGTSVRCTIDTERPSAGAGIGFCRQPGVSEPIGGILGRLRCPMSNCSGIGCDRPRHPQSMGPQAGA